MPRILTVDDSSTIRTIITKQMTDLGIEVEHAEDGIQGLSKLEEIEVDLILLDVTMPNMDGPTMLQKLRETGNKTPVIMLTSESKRQIVSGAVKLGIEDYILKPFKPDELKGKVLKALRVDANAPISNMPAVAQVVQMPQSGPAPAPEGQRQFIDVLLIDDMENVHKKLRSFLPAHVSMNACVSAREALQMCQERIFRIVLVDMVIPDVNSVALMNQIRALQPHAVMVALALRTSNDFTAEAKGQGFHDALFKPFETEALDTFLSKHFESNDLLATDGNVMACAQFDGKDDKVDRYFTRLKSLCKETLEKLASACYEESILDLSSVPAKSDKVVRFVIDTEKEARRLGISLMLVGKTEIKRVMDSITETASLPFYPTLAEARSAEA
ncbi:MAG TPA: response regulator [Kofleriaceae bacterium]|nr:response regulator [Kofleriaceae bacterium]